MESQPQNAEFSNIPEKKSQRHNMHIVNQENYMA